MNAADPFVTSTAAEAVIPSCGVIRYAVIGSPPSFWESDQVVVADRIPADATTSVGASGTVAGVTLAGTDGPERPTALRAVTTTE